MLGLIAGVRRLQHGREIARRFAREFFRGADTAAQEAAEKLGISRSTLRKKLAIYDLD